MYFTQNATPMSEYLTYDFDYHFVTKDRNDNCATTQELWNHDYSRRSLVEH